MSQIAENLKSVLSEIPQGVQLVAVSKFHPAEHLMQAYQAGARIFGESRVQELCEKKDLLPDDIQWHFIGHLQPNKVKYIAPFVSLIHAVDTPKLLKEIDKQGRKCGRRIPCLLQLHVAKEETKFGFTVDELFDFLETDEWREYDGAQIVGIMCMATNTDDENQIESEFETAAEVFCQVKNDFFRQDDDFCIRSWGMSDDFPIALRHGSTHVRIGTRIFGPREY